ncbi:uncharacterized protein LOC100443937 isoform X3 [Pongo abelii]|uniref:uncharacterized protein LOC100443937 isoform X3 n=1 Tax=Pongo abelii TaxID=9601 RepID=UPI0023E8AA65|nr:uncharacterized protein LOC100443937 isoform X3 [Pongo abelii]
MVPQEETLPCLRGLSNWMPGMARLLLSPSFGLESFPQQRGQLVKRKGTPRGHGPVQRQATSPLLSVSFQPPGDGQTPAMPSSRDKVETLLLHSLSSAWSIRMAAPAPLKSFVPTERFLFGPRRVEERLGLTAEVGKAPAPREGGTQGASQDLICLQRHTDGLALASDYLQLRWMFTGTQPEFASLHFIPERTCFPHFTFREDTSNCGHTQKRLPAPFDVTHSSASWQNRHHAGEETEVWESTGGRTLAGDSCSTTCPHVMLKKEKLRNLKRRHLRGPRKKISIEVLLHTRHCTRCWGSSHEQERQGPCPHSGRARHKICPDGNEC